MSALSYAETLALGLIVISALALCVVTWALWSITRTMKQTVDLCWSVVRVSSDLEFTVQNLKRGSQDVERMARHLEHIRNRMSS